MQFHVKIPKQHGNLKFLECEITLKVSKRVVFKACPERSTDLRKKSVFQAKS